MDKINSISFKAIPINKIKIQKFNKQTKQFLPIEAAFVMLSSKNKIDLHAIDIAAKKWKRPEIFQEQSFVGAVNKSIDKPEGAKYAQRISTAAHWMDDNNFSNIKVYALTTQENKYSQLSSAKIVGLVEMREDKNNHKNMIVNNLQVRPDGMYKNREKISAYKNTGTAILDSLKKIYKNMSLFSDEDAELFYKKNGFICDDYGESHYVWHSNILKRVMVRLRVWLENLLFPKIEYRE